MTYLYDTRQPWYRGNLHTHTTLSDGALSPEDAIARYRAEGYSFLAITDHWGAPQSFEEPGFVLLGGTELDCNDFDARSAFHIIGLGIESKPDSKRGDRPQRLIDSVREAGGLAVLGHPHWSLLSHQDMIGLVGIFATEVYSGVSEAYTGRGDSTAYADACMAKNCPKLLLGVDDTHFYDRDLFQAWIMLQADCLTREGILAALEAGRFYATEGGPAFRQITVERDTIRVECEEAVRIDFLSDTFWVGDRVRYPREQLLTAETYTVDPQDRYVRVQLTGANGKRSTSQYIPVNR